MKEGRPVLLCNLFSHSCVEVRLEIGNRSSEIDSGIENVGVEERMKIWNVHRTSPSEAS